MEHVVRASLSTGRITTEEHTEQVLQVWKSVADIGEVPRLNQGRISSFTQPSYARYQPMPRRPEQSGTVPGLVRGLPEIKKPWGCGRELDESANGSLTPRPHEAGHRPQQPNA